MSNLFEIDDTQAERDNNPLTEYNCKMCGQTIRGIGRLAHHMKTHAIGFGAKDNKDNIKPATNQPVDFNKLNTVEKRANLGPLQVGSSVYLILD